MPSNRALCLLLALLLVCNLSPAAATTVAHLSWRELVYNSDFVTSPSRERDGFSNHA